MDNTHWLPKEEIGSPILFAYLFDTTTVTVYDIADFEAGFKRSNRDGGVISVTCVCH